MASLDFVRDLTDKIQSQGLSYMMIVFEKDKKQGSASIFSHFEDRVCVEAVVEVMRGVHDNLIDAIVDDTKREEKEAKKAMKKKDKNAGK